MLIRILIFISSFTGGYFVHSWLQDSENKILKERILESEKKIEALKLRSEDLKTHLTKVFESSDTLKAEELLAKIMQVFLADLSLRLNPQGLHIHSQESEIVTGIKTPIATNGGSLAPKMDPQPATGAAKPSAANEERRQFENKIQASRNEREATEDLGKLQFQNFFEVMSKAKPIDSKSAQLLNGKFNGYITPAKSGKPAITLSLEVVVQDQGEHPLGSVKIIESREGKVFSRSNGNGALKNFSISENSAMLIVEHNGGDGYMQLYYSTPGDFFIGNHYEKNSPTQYTLSGRIFLQRTR